MLVIRLNRYGKRNQAQFRVILQEKSKAPGHRHVEVLGSYNPHSKETLLKKERILYWVGQGAEPSDRVHNMLVKAGVIEGKIIPKKMKRPEKKEEARSMKSGESKATVPTETQAEETKVEEVKTEVPAAGPVKVKEAPKVEALAVEEAPKVETPAEAVKA